ncbi:hypothetical protein Tco_0738534 [Tanacetum coccineum]
MEGGKMGNAVKPSARLFLENSKANMQWGYRTMENPHKNKDLGIVDSGCSRSMIELQNFTVSLYHKFVITKNKVLFTDKECLVLSKEFQLLESSQVVLRVPRRNNLYCFNLSDIYLKEMSHVAG